MSGSEGRSTLSLVSDNAEDRLDNEESEKNDTESRERRSEISEGLGEKWNEVS